MDAVEFHRLLLLLILHATPSCRASALLDFFFFFGRQIHCSSVIPDFDDTLYAPLLPLSLS